MALDKNGRKAKIIHLAFADFAVIAVKKAKTKKPIVNILIIGRFLRSLSASLFTTKGKLIVLIIMTIAAPIVPISGVEIVNKTINAHQILFCMLVLFIYHHALDTSAIPVLLPRFVLVLRKFFHINGRCISVANSIRPIIVACP